MKKQKCFRIFGIVRREGRRKGIPGLRVQALDKDLFFDDRLGTATTDSDGRFEIRYDTRDFKDFFDFRPDIYLKVTDSDGAELFTTEDKVRYEADDTEEFPIELPTVTEYIGDTKGLMRHLLDDEALLAELSETVAGPLQEKNLLADGLAFTLVPRVYDQPKTEAGLFVTGLGPQPIPPGMETFVGTVSRSSKFIPSSATTREYLPPWWWWIGLPTMEFLQWLDRLRASDIPVMEQTGLPTRESADFAHCIMADKSLVTELSGTIARLFSKHGLVMEAGKTYVFTPVVYERPLFAGAAFVPQVIDSATRPAQGFQGWVNPVDGVMPPYLQQVVHPEA